MHLKTVWSTFQRLPRCGEPDHGHRTTSGGPDHLARVVIDEQSGIIVMGENVRINTVAIAQGDLIDIRHRDPQVSQLGPFAEAGETATAPRTNIEVDESANVDRRLADEGVTLQQLVNGLNVSGIGPRGQYHPRRSRSPAPRPR